MFFRLYTKASKSGDYTWFHINVNVDDGTELGEREPGSELNRSWIFDHALLQDVARPLDVSLQALPVGLAQIGIVLLDADQNPGHVRQDPLHLVCTHRLLLIRLDLNAADESSVVVERDGRRLSKLAGDGW